MVNIIKKFLEEQGMSYQISGNTIIASTHDRDHQQLIVKIDFRETREPNLTLVDLKRTKGNEQAFQRLFTSIKQRLSDLIIALPLKHFTINI